MLTTYIARTQLEPADISSFCFSVWWQPSACP